MEKNIANKNIFKPGSLLFFISSLLIIISCNPTKYVPQEETLLDNNVLLVNKEGIKKTELEPYIRQKPNKQIFGTRFHLGLYNLSNLSRDKWPHPWLRQIGEEPVIFDPYAADKSVEQLQSYIASRGYFDSKVLETVETANRKSKVYYNVDLKPPYTIRNVFYQFADTVIRELFYFDSVNCMIERGRPYDVDILQAERSRFERFIRDHGFYGFSGEHIFFRIDSTAGDRQVDIYYGVKEFQKLDNEMKYVTVPHSMYRVRNVYIYPDFVPKEALEGGDTYIQSLDTTLYNGYYFISSGNKPEIKYDLILQAVYLNPGSLFNVTNTEQTQSHLLALKTYRLVNIYYNELSDPAVIKRSEQDLDCIIQLTLLSQQSYRIEIEGTNSVGNLGGALNLIYQHKNLFHRAELFNLKLKGAYEALPRQDSIFRSTQEFGVETSLRLPEFLMPFLRKESFVKKYNPTTTLLAAYNFQKMPFYTRTLANATFGYSWNGGNYNTHIVNPLQLNIVKLPFIDPEFKEKIESSTYIAYSYQNVMILGGSYSFIFNNQKIQKSRDYWFLRINAEAAGNFLSLAGNIAGFKKEDGSYFILDQPFAQYLRADMDLRYNVIINDVSSIVYRGYMGAGIPYGNSKAMPFEKQFFGGGANGIRAWQVRTLGPGSYVPDDSKFLNITADLKIEANIEYRFNLFWILEGALFLDAGNIWSVYNDPARPGSQFSINSFYKDIAVGTGTGLRFDLNFVLMRADLGMKLRDPSIKSGSSWIMLNRPYNFKDDFSLVVAIGYPF